MNRTLLALLAIAISGPALAQDEPQPSNAFAVVVANRTIVRAAEKQLMVVATLAGPFFVESDEGPIHAGRVTCAASTRIDQATAKQVANGACTFPAVDGAVAWGDGTCEGYELVGCRGTFKLAGGTARLEGAAGEGALLWRPSAHELKKQLDGSVLDNATGVLVWRDLKLKAK